MYDGVLTQPIAKEGGMSQIDPVEIVAAAHIRDLAVAKRETEWAAYARENDIQPSPSSTEKTKWRTLNPISNYVPWAYDELQDIAKQVRVLS